MVRSYYSFNCWTKKKIWNEFIKYDYLFLPNKNWHLNFDKTWFSGKCIKQNPWPNKGNPSLKWEKPQMAIYSLTWK